MCEYCSEPFKPIRNDYLDNEAELTIFENQMTVSMFVETNNLELSYENCFNISYCPMCGEKLEES